MIIADELLEKPTGHWEPDDYRVARKLLGMTQAELGNLLGLSRQWIVQIENGHNPAPSMMALGIKYLILHGRMVRDGA